MDVHHQTRSQTSVAPIDSERASIAMRLVMMCGEFIKAGEPQKALEAYHHARDILDGLAASQKHNVDLGLTLSLLHRRIGDLMRAQGDLEGAKEAYQSSLAIAERLASFHPGNEELQRNRSEALAALSTVSGTFDFGPKLDCAIKRLEGFPSLHEALASATNSRVEVPAPAADVEASATERRVAAPSHELPHEVRGRIALANSFTAFRAGCALLRIAAEVEHALMVEVYHRLWVDPGFGPHRSRARIWPAGSGRKP